MGEKNNLACFFSLDFVMVRSLQCDKNLQWNGVLDTLSGGALSMLLRRVCIFARHDQRSGSSCEATPVTPVRADVYAFHLPPLDLSVPA